MTRIRSLVDRTTAMIAVGLPLSLSVLSACDPPRRRTEAPAKPPVSEEPKVIPAGGLPPRSESTESATPNVATYDAAEAAFKGGKYREAKELFAGYLVGKPEHSYGFYMLGMSAWKDGELRAAEKAFAKAVSLDPKHVKSYLNGARVLLDLGRAEEAREKVIKALELEPNSTEALRTLARSQAAVGRIDEAVESYRKVLIADDQDLWALNNLGMLYVEVGDPDAALGPLARAAQLKPNSPVFLNNLGIALELDGYPVAAKESYKAAVKADSGYTKAAKNVERLNAFVSDSATKEPVSVKKIADLFRLEIGMWRDSVAKPVTDTAVPAPKPDSLPPAR